MHAVQAHAAIAAVVVLKDDFFRAPPKDGPVPGHGGERVAGDIAGGPVEHQHLQRGVNVAIRDLYIRPTHIDRTGATLIFPASEKDLLGVGVVAVRFVVIDKTVQPHDHAADGDVARVGGKLR